jgi:hypothetical protein
VFCCVVAKFVPKELVGARRSDDVVYEGGRFDKKNLNTLKAV